MGPKNSSKKGNKAGNPKQGRRNVGRPPISVAPVVRPAAPTTPIPPLTVLASQPELKTLRTSNGGERTLKKWCFDNTPVYFAPEEPWPSTSLNRGAIVEVTGEKQRISATGVKTAWSEVAYKIQDPQAAVQWVKGWVNDAYLDDYNERFPDSGVVIPHPTEDPKDAGQYMIWEGKVRYNLCGEFCVAFIVEQDIDSVLAKWKEKSPNSYNAILGAGRDGTTSENDLRNVLCAVLGEHGDGLEDDQLVSLRTKLTYPVTPVGLWEDLKSMLVTHYLIAGVTINDAGELIGKENPRIKHWIVLDRITRYGNRVEVYNPFPNRVEEYSFAELYRSCSTNSGLWVKRKRPRAGSATQDLPTLKVAISNPNPSYRAAQYIDVDGKKKTNLCGEFCTAFIVRESINTVLQHWKEAQPFLYADIVGNNRGTGTFALKTILQSYGYNNEGDILEFNAGLTDPYLKKYLLSPGRIAKMLATYYLIAGVNIDGLTGKLKPGNDVRHWVVVDKLTPAGKNRGWVELYNPYPNSWEEYSYKEFINAVGYWSGLWVKREIVPLYVPQVVAGSNVEDRPGEPLRIGQWTEAQLLAALQRMSKGKKSLNKIATKLAELSGWKRRDVLSRLRKFMQTGKVGVGMWTETKLRQEMERRLRSGKPISKISAELAKTSGWKKRDVISVLNRLIESQKWTETQLLAAIRQKLQVTRSANKIASELAGRSGWKKREIISRIKQVIESQKWTEAQLRAEIARRLQARNPLSKISARLAEVSGWKKREITVLIKSVLESQKWTETQLLAALRERLKAAKPVNKIVTELAELSRWKKREIIDRLKKLLVAEKWTEVQLRQEIERRLKEGNRANKITAALAQTSGWKKWEIDKIIKAIRQLAKAAESKKHRAIEEEVIVPADPRTIVQASKRRAEYVEWQDELLSTPGTKLRQLRKWGDPLMIAQAGYSVDIVGTTNFQAVKLWSPEGGWGGVTNFLHIPHEHVMKLAAMQIEDQFVAKKFGWNEELNMPQWLGQKMSWLCKDDGTIYIRAGGWRHADTIRWGTIALGGNLVTVEGTQVVTLKLPRETEKREVTMARLKGFRVSDWNRPLDELLAEGLVHRCFCAYKSDHFGDTPKGIIYSPFFSPQNWDFAGKVQPRAFYVPVDWLEPKTE